jgi:hypothetical protein
VLRGRSLAISAEPDVNDRIDDELIVALAETDNRPDLEITSVKDGRLRLAL